MNTTHATVLYVFQDRFLADSACADLVANELFYRVVALPDPLVPGESFGFAVVEDLEAAATCADGLRRRFAVGASVDRFAKGRWT